MRAMCGFSGMLAFGGMADETAVRAMTSRLAHRGPDASGIRAFPKVVLGHRRLAIIDLSDAGQQPMSDRADRYHLVYNGELYNYRSLRAQLVGNPCWTQTDTEVLLHTLIQGGRSALSDFNGMFAFAFWDREREELWLGRDPLGIKPLYFYRDRERLVFASELRALLASGYVPAKLDADGVVDFLRTQTVQAPATVVEGVHMLLPGCLMRARPDGFVSIERYHSLGRPDPSASAAELSDGQIHQRVRELLSAAVERRLVADVPFGAFLSGGIDSSVIVGLMSQVLNQPVQTFSVGFDEEEFSEAPFARAVARRFATDHHEIRLSAGDFLETVPEALSAMDHPSGDGPNTYVVSRATRRAGVTMALSGLGGDELFAGYEVFRRASQLRRMAGLGRLPRPLRAAAGGVVRRVRPGVAGLKLEALMALPDYQLASYYPITRRLFLDDALGELLRCRPLPPDRTAHIARMHSPTALPASSQLSLCEINTYMQNTLLRDTDQMSMAVALEVRVPFLDRDLVDFVLTVPDRLKFGQKPKALLIDSLPGLLPEEIVVRPKMGFTLPWANWLHRELRPLCEQRLLSLAERSLFLPGAIAKLWARFSLGDPAITWSRVWALVVLEDWLQRAGM